MHKLEIGTYLELELTQSWDQTSVKDTNSLLPISLLEIPKTQWKFFKLITSQFWSEATSLSQTSNVFKKGRHFSR